VCLAGYISGCRDTAMVPTIEIALQCHEQHQHRRHQQHTTTYNNIDISIMMIMMIMMIMIDHDQS